MDGTLTVPVIDFHEMRYFVAAARCLVISNLASNLHYQAQVCRRRCGVMTGDVLDTVASWPAEKQLVANQAIREVEQEVCHQLCNFATHLSCQNSILPSSMLLHGKDVHSSVQTKHIMTVRTARHTQDLSMVAF